jgi:hypothetical protein
MFLRSIKHNGGKTMDKKFGLATLAILTIASLLIGGVVTYTGFPKEVVKEVEVPVEDLVEVPGPVEYVNVTVEKEVEVEKDWLNLAYDEFIDEYEDNDDSPAGYDFDQLVKHKFSDEYTVTYDDDLTTVNFDVELKFLDKDTKEKEYVNYSVEVVFEEDEDNIEVTY